MSPNCGSGAAPKLPFQPWTDRCTKHSQAGMERVSRAGAGSRDDAFEHPSSWTKRADPGVDGCFTVESRRLNIACNTQLPQHELRAATACAECGIPPLNDFSGAPMETSIFTYKPA